MNEQGTVAFTKASTGGKTLRTGDGSYILAEQLDAKPLQIGQALTGRMSFLGIESDQRAAREFYGVFIQAYALSMEAVRNELR